MGIILFWKNKVLLDVWAILYIRMKGDGKFSQDGVKKVTNIVESVYNAGTGAYAAMDVYTRQLVIKVISDTFTFECGGYANRLYKRLSEETDLEVHIIRRVPRNL